MVKICDYLADVIDSGPFGGERPVVEGNVITFESMMGKFSYRVYDDGSVDVLWNDVDSYDLEDFEMTREELVEYINDNSHFDSIEELAESGDSWFDQLTETDLYNINKLIKK